MRRARVLAHGELSDHLPVVSVPVEIAFELPAGVRDLVQSIGIPHVEVERLEVNGSPTDWGHRIDDGDSIELWARYPMATAEDNPRFLVDGHLGKLARHLRLLGFDTAWDAADDVELVARTAAEGRILLTRDRQLLKRRSLVRGRWIRAIEPITQATEVMRAFHLASVIDAFTRCLECNGVLSEADPATVQVPEGVRRRQDTFGRCLDCGRVYWAGTHYRRLVDTVERISEGIDQTD